MFSKLSVATYYCVLGEVSLLLKDWRLVNKLIVCVCFGKYGTGTLKENEFHRMLELLASYL